MMGKGSFIRGRCLRSRFMLSILLLFLESATANGMLLPFSVNYFFLKTNILPCEKEFGEELVVFLEFAVAFIVCNTAGV